MFCDEKVSKFYWNLLHDQNYYIILNQSVNEL